MRKNKFFKYDDWFIKLKIDKFFSNYKLIKKKLIIQNKHIICKY